MNYYELLLFYYIGLNFYIILSLKSIYFSYSCYITNGKVIINFIINIILTLPITTH